MCIPFNGDRFMEVGQLGLVAAFWWAGARRSVSNAAIFDPPRFEYPPIPVGPLWRHPTIAANRGPGS
jgi:hypothetical protein